MTQQIYSNFFSEASPKVVVVSTTSSTTSSHERQFSSENDVTTMKRDVESNVVAKPDHPDSRINELNQQNGSAKQVEVCFENKTPFANRRSKSMSTITSCKSKCYRWRIMYLKPILILSQVLFYNCKESWVSTDFFSRGVQKFSRGGRGGGQEPTFCLKNNKKDTIFPKKV